MQRCPQEGPGLTPSVLLRLANTQSAQTTLGDSYCSHPILRTQKLGQRDIRKLAESCNSIQKQR